MARTVSDLTIDEIERGNTHLPDTTDLETAIVQGGRHRWAALAVLSWLHAQRDAPAATLEQWRGKTATDLMDYLGVNDTQEAVDPTQPPS